MKNKSSVNAPHTKLFYKIKLEIDFLVAGNEENKEIQRGLRISLKKAENRLKDIESEIYKQILTDEFEYFSKRGFNSIRELITLLHREIVFNLIGKKSEREQFIKNSLASFEKGMRKRLQGKRGRPKVDDSFHALFDSIEIDLFVMDIFGAIKKIKKAKRKVTKTAVAKELFPKHSNQVQTFNRKLKQFKFTFEDVLNEKLIHIDLLTNFLNNPSEITNNKSQGI